MFTPVMGVKLCIGMPDKLPLSGYVLGEQLIDGQA